MIKELLIKQDYDKNIEYDVIVVGTGPGGATVAREMALRKKRVLMLESGPEMSWIQGNTAAMSLSLKNLGFNLSREMTAVAIPNVYGGASNLTCGMAGPPNEEFFAEAGIAFDGEIEEAKKDLHIQELSDVLVGEDNLRMMDAANDCGYGWNKIPKMIDPDRCIPGCSDCMLGCTRRAKWTSREYADEAIRNGADLMLYTRVTDVIVENGRVTGVIGRRLGRSIEAHAKIVVLSAGVSNVGILRRAGIDEAGREFACDLLVFTGGVTPGSSSVRANPMAVGTLDDWGDGYIMSETGPNWASLAVELALMKPLDWRHMLNLHKHSWIMVKIQDETGGEIFPEKRFFNFSKPITERDRKRLDTGVEKSKNILKKMGAKDHSIVALPPIGAHPCGTCAVGKVVDTNLETRIPNLFCCDASIFHRSMGLPVVWTAASLGKRLARHLETRIY